MTGQGTSDDRELIALAARGDKRAFSQLMATHEDMVFAVSLRMLRDREAALDATQETFITLYRKADRFRGDSAVSTWLYRIAVNTCLDQLRKMKRRPSEPLEDSYDPVDPSAMDQVGSVELRPSVEEALSGLADDFRAAVVLSDIHGLGVNEIAEILGVPVGTVKSRVFRGRRLLAERLGNLIEPASRPTDEEHA